MTVTRGCRHCSVTSIGVQNLTFVQCGIRSAPLVAKERDLRAVSGVSHVEVRILIAETRVNVTSFAERR